MPEAISPLHEATAPASAPAAKPADQFGKDTFLKLLVAQLKFQNPMKPTDGAEFMAQTAQMTMVEKIEELAKSTAEVLAANRTLAASTLIGRHIVAEAADGRPVSGVVSGSRLGVTGPVLKVGDTEVPLSAVKEVNRSPQP